jgi:hypothetical protein
MRIREDLKKVALVTSGESISHIRVAKAEIKTRGETEVSLEEALLGAG